MAADQRTTGTGHEAVISRVGGFDSLRVLAMGMVYLQHQLTVLGYEASASIFGISIGHAGVSIFLALSGFFAAGDRRPKTKWIRRRLLRIYPPYLIIILISFILTYLSGYEEFKTYQFVSQVLGTGFFTHSMDLVNTATWFVSLILLLYLITALLKSTSYDSEFSLCITSLLLGIVIADQEIGPPVFSHSISYFASYYFFSSKTKRLLVSVWGFLFVLIAFSIEYRTFAYPGIALLFVASARYVERAPKLISNLSRYSYEFYLCHGIFLTGSQVFFPAHPAVSILFALIGSSISAILLKSMTEKLEVLMSNRMHGNKIKETKASKP